MGYIDKLKVSVSCVKCKTFESQSVLQKGSSFGASWQSFSDFAKFDATFSTSNGEPSVASARCKQCGGEAEVDSNYSI